MLCTGPASFRLRNISRMARHILPMHYDQLWHLEPMGGRNVIMTEVLYDDK